MTPTSSSSHTTSAYAEPASQRYASLPVQHRRRAVSLWILAHALPLLALPLLTLLIGTRIGVNTLAVILHATTLLFVPVLQARALRLLVSTEVAWTVRAVLGLGVAIAIAMVLMSTIDVAGYDAAATPTAMSIAGAVYGVFLCWPFRRTARAGVVVLVSALGWLAGTAMYGVMLADALRWEISGQSLYGFAYTGGHNELLWVGAGLLGFGLLTTPFLLTTRTRAAASR